MYRYLTTQKKLIGSLVTCPTCKKRFPYSLNRRKFCSRKCVIDSFKKKKDWALINKDRFCVFCKGIFRSSVRDQRFCSKKCYYEYVKYQNWLRKRKPPNKSEKLLIKLIGDNKFPFKYVGNYSYFVGKKNPDFIGLNDHKDKIIELFGGYWHTKRVRNFHRMEWGRKLFYNKHSYDCLIIWDHELKNLDKVKQKIENFIGGD